MDASLKLWIVIIVVGALNYVSRLSFIAIFARREVPPLMARAFRYVPAAMLTALVLPMVVSAPGAVDPVDGARIVAAVAAFGAAFVTHSTLKTLGVGMATLWIAQAALKAIG